MKNKSDKKSLILGVTGIFGSGKTTTAGMFKRLGAACINADRIYHRLLRPNSTLYRKIVSAFGDEILNNNEKIDRKKLANLVFGKKADLKRLVRITHPTIIKKINDRLIALKGTKKHRVFIIDAPLLIEAGLIKLIDKLIVVKTNRKHLINRAKKSGMSETKIIKRIGAQAPESLKIKLADFVIDNSGTLKQTEKQVKDIWTAISAKL